MKKQGLKFKKGDKVIYTGAAKALQGKVLTITDIMPIKGTEYILSGNIACGEEKLEFATKLDKVLE